MSLLDQPKLEELRIAILNDLKDFIPENHYIRVARYDPKSRATCDKDLCRYLYEDRDNHPLKYLPRHMATLNLFYHVQSYNSLLIALSIANEMQSRNELLVTYKDTEDSKYFDPFHINNRLFEVGKEIEKSLKNWLHYLSDEESRPFINGCLRHIVDENKLKRSDQQINIIKTVALELTFDLHQIPDRGKAAIKEKCTTNYRSLFTKSAFVKVWQKGLKEGHFKMANHEKFSNKKNKMR